MGSSRRSILVIFVCAVSLLLVTLLTLSLGAVRLSLIELPYGLKEVDSPAGRILPHVQVSRLLATALARAGLSASGVLIQTALQNPFTSPGIIGVNAGAGLAVALCMVLLPGVVPALPFTAFLDALTSVLLVYRITRRAGASCITFMLSGAAFSSLMTVGINTLVTVSLDTTTGLRDFQNGGSEGVFIGISRPAGFVILFGFLVSLLPVGELDALDLGEITVSSLGLPARFYCFLFLALVVTPAGTIASFAGLPGFVGLIVSHIARFLLKDSGKWNSLLLSTLLGAAFLILCDTIVRTTFAFSELPVGILAAYLDVLFFLWLLSWERRKCHD